MHLRTVLMLNAGNDGTLYGRLWLLAAAILLLGLRSASAQPQSAEQGDLRWLMRVQEGCARMPGCGIEKLSESRHELMPGRQMADQPDNQASGLSVVNAASFQPPVGPGVWVTIRGLDLGGASRTWDAADFLNDLMPTVLAGTSVRIGNRDAAISYVSPAQINALVPADATAGSTTVTVSSPVGPPASTTITLDQFAPALFMFAPENRRYVAAVHPDGTLAGKQGLFSDNPTLTRPVKAGEQFALYATGLGSTNPEVPPGKYFSDPRPMNGVEFFHVAIGGTAATVEWVGAVSPGLYQINIVAPVMNSGDYSVAIDYGGAGSPAGPMITIQGDPALSQLRPSPASLELAAFTNSDTPSSQTLQLVSTGEDFPFTLRSSAPWLTFDSSSGRTPATIRVLADARSLTPGTYHEQITVLAPGTASPSTTISVTVTASNVSQITVSRISLKYQLVTGFQSLDVPVNVLSGTSNVDFTVSKTGDSWLTVLSSGRTPGVVRIGLNSENRPAGVLTGTVRITPAGGGTPRDVDVTLTIVATAASGGAPQIVALDQDELLWGRTGAFGFYGQNLTGATSVTISPAQGFSVTSVESSSSSRVNMNLAVGPSAAEGLYTITVTTSRGTSNAFPFTVRNGQPQIRDPRPTVVTPGRFYSTTGLIGGIPGPAMAFGLSGIDLQGITSLQVDPSGGVSALVSNPPSSSGVVEGVLTIGEDAAPGIRRVSVLTPAGRSNELVLEIRPPSANAPVISNFSINSTSTNTSTGVITYSGTLSFQDADGDVVSGSTIYLMADLGTGGEHLTLVVDSGKYLNQPGKAATISFQFQKDFQLLALRLTGKIPIVCMIQDAAGNLSNVVRGTVATWSVPVL